MKKKMNTKNLMVSFCALALVLVFAGAVLASPIANPSDYSVTVEGMEAYANNLSVVAGEDITIKVYFTADQNDTDVTVEAEIEGEKIEFDSTTSVFDVEEGKSYRKVLSLEVPFELKDEISNDLELTIEIDGKNHKTVLETIYLRVQRPSYNPVVKSISVPSSIDAGDSLPVEIVMKNMGYNDLDDVYVTVRIPELGIVQGPKWFGDVFNLEDCEYDCDKEDTVYGRIYVKIPYEAEDGVYEIEVIVYNDDSKTTETKTVMVNNDFSSNVIITDSNKLVSVNEDAEFDLLIVNPTNNVKVYRIVSESTDVVSSSTSASVVAVPAGSTKTVKVFASADSEGEHTFDVNIFEGDRLTETASLGLDIEGKSVNSTAILTIILAIIFLVLLVALIVLISKRPQKTEEFGESYY